MFQIINAWNFVFSEENFKNEISEEFRGYNRKTFLTGNFSSAIYEKINPLSVSDISDTLCPVRRDLYFRKGKNRPKIKIDKTWGSIAGPLTEEFKFTIFNKFNKIKSSLSYLKINKMINALSKDFKQKNEKSFKKLEKLKTIPEEEPDWLLKLLKYGGMYELGHRLSHENLLKEKDNFMQIKNLEIKSPKISFKPNPKQIGISNPATPDFLIKKYKTVGDIKSGFGSFMEHYLLTCTGYALASENEKGNSEGDINFGIILFFPTRHSERFKPISFGQVYIFHISDALRDWFLKTRNAAYDIVLNDQIPDFPEVKIHCPYCQCRKACMSEGLIL